jgi:hypothetical protein
LRFVEKRFQDFCFGEVQGRGGGEQQFVAGAVRTRLLFKPGTQLKYQSMGTLPAPEIARRIAKQLFAEFLANTVFKLWA